VLSVTYIKGGKSVDGTPSFVEFGGTLRSLTTEGLHRLEKRLKEVSIMSQFNLLKSWHLMIILYAANSRVPSNFIIV
jgi:hypothetical protein